jgi:phosphoribosylglycinamide formyltransferase-1
VTPDLDHGPIILQAAVPVLSNDTAQTLSARVLQQEHFIYPQVIRGLCKGDISLNTAGRVVNNCEEVPTNVLISPRMEES